MGTVALLILSATGFAQQSYSDSLLSLLKKDKTDTAKIIHLNNLGWELMYNNPDTSILLSKQALTLSENLLSNNSTLPDKSKIKGLLTGSLENLGVYHQIKGDYPKALDYTLKALKIYEELLGIAMNPSEKNVAKKGMASCYLNLGTIYKDQNDNQKGLDYFLKALTIDEELGNKMEMAAALGNIGIVYYDEASASASPLRDSLYKITLDYYQRSLKIAEELRNKSYQAIALGNIGNIYDDLSRTANPQIKNPESEALCNKALDYYFKALKIDEEIGNQNGVARHFSNIGSLYTSMGKFKEAEVYLKKAVAFDDSIGAVNDLRQDEESLSKFYDTTAQVAARNKRYEEAATNYRLSILHFKKAMSAKDIIFNLENKKELTRKEMNFAFEKKEAAMKAEQDKQAAIAAAENKKKNIILLFAGLGLLLTLVFALYMWRAYVQKKKANKKITLQKEQVQKQKEEIESHRNELSVKNKKITDSINYAKRIQEAILPSGEELSKYFPDHFIFFRPKDIVSGDFYWYFPVPLLSSGKIKIDASFEEYTGGVIFAVADCTGHGVPGALMSTIGNTLLNKIVNEQGILQPAEILNHLQKGISQALHQESRSQDDGMDISICLFNKERTKMIFAGANHSVFLVQDNLADEIKGDLYSIGSMFSNKNAEFAQKEISLNKNTSVFLFTDGFPDQVGGASRKKYFTKRLEPLFLRIGHLNCKEQEKIIINEFDTWKGAHVQIDDVLLVGIKTGISK